MNFTNYLLDSIEWIQHSGWMGVLWFIILYSLTCIFFLPGSLLTLGAGAVYGVWFGTLIVTISSAVGAAASFLISRYLAHGWIQRKLGHTRRFHALERAVGKEGWKIILISRISPIVPHSLVSYAAGLTSISFWRFTIASFLGFLPLSAAYAYIGALLGDALRLHASLAPRDPVSWAFYIAGLIATVAVVVLVARAATRAWKQYVPEKSEEPTIRPD